MGRGDPGTAVDADLGVRGDTQLREPLGQVRGVAEDGVALDDVLGGRRGHGARDMAGDPVNGLDLTAVALGGPGIQQDAAAGHTGRVVRREQRQGAGQRCEVTGGGAGCSVLRTPPDACQAARPPSSTRTSGWPVQRSSHQARAAAQPWPPS